MSAEDYFDCFNPPDPYGPGHEEPHRVEGATIQHETEKAFLVGCPEGTVWIPKSQIEWSWIDSEKLRAGFEGSIPISNWLYKKGLTPADPK